MTLISPQMHNFIFVIKYHLKVAFFYPRYANEEKKCIFYKGCKVIEKQFDDCFENMQ